MLKAHGLKYVRNGQEILADVDVTVEPGESLAVTGPSGSGKTTLLSLLSGLAKPTAGQVYIDGQPLTKFAGPELGVAVVLQGYGLVSLLTATENIEIALGAAGRPAAQAAATARSVLARLGLEAHADQLIEELSGGQQQRTAVARALALEPRLLIADEPTAELDPAARAVSLSAMFAIAADGGSLILATHDPEVAARCDRILDLKAGHVHFQHIRPRLGQPEPGFGPPAPPGSPIPPSARRLHLGPSPATEPGPAEPSLDEHNQPALIEPVLTESALTEPALTESALTEPALTESALTEPALTESAEQPPVAAAHGPSGAAEPPARLAQSDQPAQSAQPAQPGAAPVRGFSPWRQPAHALPEPVPAAQEITQLAGPGSQNAPPGWQPPLAGPPGSGELTRQAGHRPAFRPAGCRPPPCRRAACPARAGT